MSTQPLRAEAAVPRHGEAVEAQLALGKPLSLLVAWLARRAQRRALRELAREGLLLADIGLSREEALREAAKPFWRR
jgi:uncharacterized protein YjiS (DUF1127 family)